MKKKRKNIKKIPKKNKDLKISVFFLLLYKLIINRK